MRVLFIEYDGCSIRSTTVTDFLFVYKWTRVHFGCSVVCIPGHVMSRIFDHVIFCDILWYFNKCIQNVDLDRKQPFLLVKSFFLMIFNRKAPADVRKTYQRRNFESDKSVGCSTNLKNPKNDEKHTIFLYITCKKMFQELCCYLTCAARFDLSRRKLATGALAWTLVAL